MWPFRKKKSPSQASVDRISEYNMLRASVGMSPATDDDCCEGVAWVVVFDLAAEEVKKECSALPAEKRGLFMMVCASYLTWVAMRGVESYFPPNSWRYIAPLLERELSKQRWYKPETMKCLLGAMTANPPLGGKGRYTGASVGPWPEAIVAANLAGYHLPLPENIEFVLWVGIMSPKILEYIRNVAPNR